MTFDYKNLSNLATKKKQNWKLIILVDWILYLQKRKKR